MWEKNENKRGKNKVNGFWKSKKRGDKPNRPTWQEWQPAGSWA